MMTIHVLTPPPRETFPQQADTTSGSSTAYDSVWAGEEDVAGASTQEPSAPESTLERTMLAQDKIYVVLAVVLLVWLGVTALLFRNDRCLAALERRLDDT